MVEYAFRAEGLVKRFGETVALAGADLSARPGTVLGVLGPNGAGKTTAIRVLATLARPDAGTATVGGFDVVRQAPQVRRLIGLTGQHPTVDGELTGLGNLELIGRLLDLKKAGARRRAAELLDRFGLADAGKKPVATYSGGMRRRLDLAASLVGRPSVVFLDEPSAGLDPGRREELWRIVREVTAEGATVLLTTQYLEEADALADEISVIDRGRVIAHGTPAELKRVVGGQAISVRPKDPGQIKVAAAIMAMVTGREPDWGRRHELVVPVEGDGAVLELAQRFRQRGVSVAEFSLHLPGLDEVFFVLTGSSRGTDGGTDRETGDERDAKEETP